jgi:hypothetical protein
MANRRPVQQAHERAYVGHFLKWFNNTYHCNFQVVCEPNPPEAVIRSSRTTRWIEVSTAFWTKNYAQDLYSYATPDELHMPVNHSQNINMDQCFAHNFVSVVKNKLEKKSYVKWQELFGPGYLVIPIKYPWFDGQTLNLMRDVWSGCSVIDLGCFRSVYIAFNSRNEIKICRWYTIKKG